MPAFQRLRAKLNTLFVRLLVYFIVVALVPIAVLSGYYAKIGSRTVV